MDDNPEFSRKELASILGCTVLTISNREKSGLYPEPARRDNGYRYYMLSDVLSLLEITHGYLYLSSLVAVMWDKGYTDVSQCQSIIDAALSAYRPQEMNTDGPEAQTEAGLS